MRAEIITVGDELLIGQVVNTNAAYVGEQLSFAGVDVATVTAVGDHEEAIERALRDAWDRSDAIIVTGGLGPTHDDITKKVLCKFFNAGLVLHEPTVESIRGLLTSRNLAWSERAQEQAMVPQGATVIPNRYGTAPGLMFERQGKVLVAMAGVPYEMKGIIDSFVVPYFHEHPSGVSILHRTLNTTGISESLLSEKLGNIDEMVGVSNEERRATLAFLPSPQGVRIRISVRERNLKNAQTRVEEIESRIRARAGSYIFGCNEEILEEVVGRLLKERGLTIAVAESCTGGLIADRITNVPGSSDYFESGVVVYSNSSKVEFLRVAQELIDRNGAVSREVAEAMAAGVRKRASTDLGLSTTGIAGPTGGTAEKPVGLVWIGYADDRETLSFRFHLGNDRRRVKERAAQAALDLVRRKLLKMT